MATTELITSEIVKKACRAYGQSSETRVAYPCYMKEALLAVQDDITRPYRNLLEGWKRDAKAYEEALIRIRYLYREQKDECAWMEANRALKGEDHWS